MKVFAYVDPESGLELHQEPVGSFFTEIDVPEELIRRYNRARTALIEVEDEILALKDAAEAPTRRRPRR